MGWGGERRDGYVIAIVVLLGANIGLAVTGLCVLWWSTRVRGDRGR